jgi:hypothetical protein
VTRSSGPNINGLKELTESAVFAYLIWNIFDVLTRCLKFKCTIFKDTGTFRA